MTRCNVPSEFSFFNFGIFYADLETGALNTEICGTDQQYVTEESHA